MDVTTPVREHCQTIIVVLTYVTLEKKSYISLRAEANPELLVTH